MAIVSGLTTIRTLGGWIDNGNCFCFDNSTIVSGMTMTIVSSLTTI